MGRLVRNRELCRTNHADAFVQEKNGQNREAEEGTAEGPRGIVYDTVMLAERREREEEARARMLVQGQEFYAPTRPMVREFYGGS